MLADRLSGVVPVGATVPARGILPPLGPPVADVERIAVLRANALGDFIESLPALAALRSTYPFANIVLLGKGWHARFLAGWPGLFGGAMEVGRSARRPVPRVPPAVLRDGRSLRGNVIFGTLLKL